MKIVLLMMSLTLLTGISSCDKIEFNNLTDSCIYFHDNKVILCKTYYLDSIDSLGFHKKEEWEIIKVKSLADLKRLNKRLAIDPVVFQTKTKPDLIKALRISEQVIKKSLDLESKYDIKKQAEKIYNLK